MKFVVSLLSVGLFSQSVARAVSIVPLWEPEGLKRLERSNHKADFGKLISHYQNQPDRMTCSPVSGAMVLNALRYNTEKAPLVELPQKKYLAQMPEGKDGKKFDPRIRMYTMNNFMNPEALKIKSWSRLYAEPEGKDKKRDMGISLEQMRRILTEVHHANVVKTNVGNEKTASNRKEGNPEPLAKEEYENVVEAMKKNLAEPDNYVIVNFSRSALGQPGTGHITPVGAYDEKSDSFLVLDVNPFGGAIAWIDAKDLVGAMNTSDSTSNRGFLLVSDK